jgi:dTDP-4-dehydrorhamnose 3,5-epimerase
VKFHATDIVGVLRISLEPHRDDRGFFGRSYCEREFAAHGIADRFVQVNHSFNSQAGTLRGMHYTSAGHSESKVVRCIAGAIHDVVVDLRPDSSSYKRWSAVRLDAVNRESLYIPPGVAHGFLTLEPDSEVQYLMGSFYDPEVACGVRWNDRSFAIVWPAEPVVISARDAAYPEFEALDQPSQGPEK